MKIRELHRDEKIPYDLLLSADPSKDMIDEYIDRGTCYILEDNGQTIGEMILLETKPGIMEIMNIALADDYKGKGNGRILIEKAIDLAKKAKMHKLEFSTSNSALDHLALFQKCGMRIVGIEPDYFTNTYKDEVYENGILKQDMIRLEIVFSND